MVLRAVVGVTYPCPYVQYLVLHYTIHIKLCSELVDCTWLYYWQYWTKTLDQVTDCGNLVPKHSTLQQVVQFWVITRLKSREPLHYDEVK